MGAEEPLRDLWAFLLCNGADNRQTAVYLTSSTAFDDLALELSSNFRWFSTPADIRAATHSAGPNGGIQAICWKDT